MPGLHRKPVAWQCAVELVPRVYAIAWALPRDERYRLGDRLRRVVGCIPASIAACSGRHPRDRIRQLEMARVALVELDELLFLVTRLGSDGMKPLLDDMASRLGQLDTRLHGWTARLVARARSERRRLGPTPYNARPLARLPAP